MIATIELHGPAAKVIGSTARMSQFVAAWPNLSPLAYSLAPGQPLSEAHEIPILETFLRSARRRGTSDRATDPGA